MIGVIEEWTAERLLQMRAQWRGSPEGLSWTPWYWLREPIISVPKNLMMKQVRLMVDDHWQYSPIGTTERVR